MAEVKSGHLERTASEPRDKSLHTVTLAEVNQINDQIRLFRLELSDPLRFLPGQWLDVYVPGVPKAGGYTITSPPSKARLSNDSSVSPGYVELAVVFVAGGVGVNPLMSMVSSLAEKGDSGIPFEVHFLRASRLQFVERLASIFTSGKVKGRLQLFLTGREGEGKAEEEGVLFCGSEGGDVSFRTGRMTVDDVAAAAGNASERRFAVVYVCGVPTMTDDFVQKLTDPQHELGMEPHRVLCEKWW
ncbi:hypothetical protein K449DRAFT_457422 [Hypoxylon sp. EC38]|nr:hypothetical protein K449DRAFT_457422 [Hypoxylon sp. EC38]